MKKLLIMASLFWPQKNSGGPPISIMNLVLSIKEHFDISVISNNHEVGDDKPLEGIAEGWNTFDFGRAFYVPKGEHTYKNITRLIEEVAPDVIYQNSFFSFDDLLPVLRYKKRHKQVKVIVAPRGEFYPQRLGKSRPKKLLYAAAMRYSGLLKDVYFQGTGADECRQEAELLGIPESHLLNIQNLSVVTAADAAPAEKAPGTLRLVYIARVHPTKNTLQAIRWLSGVQGQVTYDIYGPIEREDYWNECLAAISELPENITVRYKGAVPHEEVAQIISGYHGYYMPTTGENFGHSIVEAMLVGRPVIISDQTPWTDVNGKGGYALALEDGAGFTQALNALCAMDSAAYAPLCRGAETYIKEKLNVEGIIAQYIEAFGGDSYDK